MSFLNKVARVLSNYHLHREIGLSTVWANGKQKSLMEDSVAISHLPFTYKKAQFTEKAWDEFDLIIGPRLW